MGYRDFEVVVIGAGPAGEVLAGRLGDNGVKVVIVERELVGGECSFYACMPSKALLRPAEAITESNRVPGAAEVTGEAPDVEATLARRDEVIADLDDSGQVPWLDAHNVELVRGHARLVGERQVEVDCATGLETLNASKAVVIATGTGAAMPPIDGLREIGAWSNREVTTAKQVPESLIVLGGGVVGSEMAQAWSSLGSKVTLVEALDRILANEEPFAGEQVADSLRERGVEIRVGTRAVAVERDGEGGPVTLTLDSGETVSGAEILVAVGRKPLSAEIGLDSVGLEPGGYLEVDDQMRVAGKDWLYAVGDINGRSLLTHMGKYQGRLAADHIMGIDGIAVTHDKSEVGSPRVTFTDPQVAAVGLTLEAAQGQGLNVRAVDVGTSATAGASFHGRNAPGTSRLVVDEDRGVIVGATFVGAETADFVHAATIAMVGEVPMERLWHAIPAFPTRSEVWLKLMEEYGL